jgi:diketogulonate reductase-like aldo/keto reductase
METLVDEGLVKSIGVSNWTVALLLDMMSYARIKPVCNQFEINPWAPRTKLVEWSRKFGIVSVGYRIVTGGIIPLPGNDPLKNPMEDPEIQAVATKHNATPGQVLVQWVLKRNCGAIVKSITPSRIIENWEA